MPAPTAHNSPARPPAAAIIPFGKGQCGACAAEEKTQIQEDVSTCGNYIRELPPACLPERRPLATSMPAQCGVVSGVGKPMFRCDIDVACSLRRRHAQRDRRARPRQQLPQRAGGCTARWSCNSGCRWRCCDGRNRCRCRCSCRPGCQEGTNRSCIFVKRAGGQPSHVAPLTCFTASRSLVAAADRCAGH